MAEIAALIAELKGPLGGAGAVAVALLVYLWRERGQRAVAASNEAGVIDSIRYWRDAVERSDKENDELKARADKFAEERNEAYRALAKVEGQLAEMTRQINAQTELLRAQAQQLDQQAQEMHGLRQQVASLKEQLDGKP